ncbi:MAG: hypothetical protein H8E24_10400 [Verrucomicrobia bacterium]|nr:hypothetical protein [Verrucomicrobiota bacterium]
MDRVRGCLMVQDEAVGIAQDAPRCIPRNARPKHAAGSFGGPAGLQVEEIGRGLLRRMVGGRI